MINKLQNIVTIINHLSNIINLYLKYINQLNLFILTKENTFFFGTSQKKTL
jgi:hypothetical protein